MLFFSHNRNGKIFEGVVKFWFRHEDNGFIISQDLSEDVFVMKKNLIGVEKLFPGQKVTFELTTDERGRVQARNVEPVLDKTVSDLFLKVCFIYFFLI